MHCNHSLNLSTEALSYLHDGLAVVGAVLFTFVMAFSAFQSSRSKGWFFWNTIFATMLEAAGCAAYAIHTQDPTNHLAFLISFSAINIAPSFLAMATFHLSLRYFTSKVPTKDELSHNRIVNGSSVFIILQSAVLILFDLGLYHIGSYISSRPIDGITGALERLAHYEQGVKLLQSSHFVQQLCFGAFIVFYTYWTLRTIGWRLESLDTSKTSTCFFAQLRQGQQHVFVAVGIVSILCMFRSTCKIIDYTSVDPAAVQLVQSRSDFWLSDALPVLIALVALCSTFSKIDLHSEPCIPYTYTQVPEIKVVCVDEELSRGTEKS